MGHIELKMLPFSDQNRLREKQKINNNGFMEVFRRYSNA